MINVHKKIKKYEPIMYSLLRRFKIKKDYEDILQRLRIKTWEVLRDDKFKKIYKDKDGNIIEAKFTTWLYKVLSDKIQDILKIDYGLKIKKDGKEVKEWPIEKQTIYYLQHPILCGLQFFPIENYDSENKLKCKLDFELYYKYLSKENKKLINLMIDCNGDKKEAVLKLNCTIRHLNRKLLILKKDYKKFLITGGN